jgi:lipopolysaccharide export system permease protein
MKIFFRYLFMRLVQPFFFCLAGFTVLWVMADLYGTMEDFLDHKVHFSLVLWFYALQIPHMLVQVLPAAVLFSTLFTLLSLNRRSEFVALQAGGLAPIWLFAPFLLFGFICTLVLGYDMSGPAAKSEVARDRILADVKGQGLRANESTNLPYVDKVNHRVWYFNELDVSGQTGKAKGVQILLQDPQWQDIKMYVAKEARWNGEFWRLNGVKEIVYNVDGLIQDQKSYEELDLPDVTTPPRELSLIVSQPEQLTLSQLADYIATSTQTPEYLDRYRTEWWYRIIYPFSIMVLMLYALLQGARSDRRSPVAGIGLTVLVLIVFTMSVNAVFLPAGRYGRLPPLVAVTFPEIFFAAIALHWLAIKNGWYWQVREWCVKWNTGRIADEKG